MAHQIENSEIAYRGEMPWHGLGTRVEDGTSSEDWLEAAGLNWTLERAPLTATVTPEGAEPYSVPVPDRFAWVRSDNRRVLTVAGKGWRPLQNRDALGFMDRYVRAGGVELETVGALRGGEVVWGLAKLKHSFQVRRGDKVEGYLLLTSPNTLGTAISIRTTTVRVVCANTMAMAERSSEAQYRQNHLSDFDVEKAREAVANAHEVLALAEKRAKTLDRMKIKIEDAMQRVIIPVFTSYKTEEEVAEFKGCEPEKLPKAAADILKSIVEAPGALPGTGWGVLNGITHYCDHVAGKDADARLYQSWVGWKAAAKVQAEKKLLELADAA